ncbi:ATP-binding cassette domain-containing protein [Microbacterium sp. ZXX196]|uniref:ATP-binding cassette domain-containing protein n=1 Tax=Microbacterium sp. ZXX196 TaxID=2609291 RepID=UPI0012B9646F|nr:ATP-binding cassette domain-containing protein [Microbacterium sp. ZXX196]
MTDSLVSLRGLGVTHHGSARPALRDVTLEIRAGEVVLLAGPSGSGKSTLARAIAGLLSHEDGAEVSGEATVAGVDARRAAPAALSASVGVVFQDPDAQVVTATVLDEVAFALENLLVSADEIAARAERALRAAGLWERRGDDPQALSGGGRQRLAIACALATDPAVLIADEPTAMLDPEGTAEVARALANAAAGGERAVLLIEHDLDVALPLATRLVVLDHDGSVALDGPPARLLAERGAALGALGIRPPRHARPAGPRPAGDLVVVDDVTLRRGGQDAVRGLSARVPRGSFTAVVGPNGSGKTTLAQAIAGLIAPASGAVLVDGADARRARDRVRFVFQNPEHQFVAHTVRAELEVGLRGSGLPPAEREAEVDRILRRLGLAELADRHPFHLSGGQKRRLSVATALVGMAPGGLLVLDEPLYGQDGARADALLDLVEELRRAGTTIVVVTHDPRLVAERATHVIEVFPVPREADPPPAPLAGPLSRLHPLAKFAGVVPAMAGLVFVRDPLTPALVLALVYATLLAGTRPSRRLALWLGVALPAVGGILAVGLGAWGDPASGIATGLRLAALLGLALVPGLTTDGTDTVRALVAGARIPYRVGYAALAALRFVPRFRDDLGVIRQAHRVRGTRGAGPLAAPRLLVPLLAGGIRHAERVALAMDARAFGAHATRTERHRAPWRRRDTAFVLAALAATATCFVVGAVA